MGPEHAPNRPSGRCLTCRQLQLERRDESFVFDVLFPGSWFATAYCLLEAVGSILLNVVEAQLDWRIAAKNVDEDGDLRLVEVDRLDHAVEVRKGPRDNSHGLTHLPGRLEPGFDLLL